MNTFQTLGVVPVVLASFAAGTLLSACSTAHSAPAKAQKQVELNIQKAHDGATVVLVEDGKTQQLQLTQAQLADDKALMTALAALPEARRQQVLDLLHGVNLPPVPAAPGAPAAPMVVMKLHEGAPTPPAAPMAPEAPMVWVHADENGGTQKHVIVRTMRGPMSFDVIKTQLQQGTFTKAQLQELQKIIDSKF